MSDVFGETTTAATASPTFRHALSIGGSESKTVNNSKLHEVSEVPVPKLAVQNNYRLARLLHKGDKKLMKMVDHHARDLEKSFAESNKMSHRMMSNRDRIKLSIMSTRSNAIQTPNLANTMDAADREAFSGFNTAKNAYLKN